MITTLHNILRSHYLSLFLFLSVGILAALVNFSSFAFFYKIAGFGYQEAVTIAYFLALLVHFTCNRHFTFKKSSATLSPQLLKYSVMVMINYGITLAVICFVVEYLHLSAFIGLLVAIGLTVGSGYLLSRFWVFKLSAKTH